MDVKKFLDSIECDCDTFFTGVPDSKLKSLCNYLIDNYGVGDSHVIAANEGNAVSLAAGSYIATGKPAVVYMQNSGLGNMINPVESLLRIYEIPCIFIIGWRGEPNIHDEPQHIYQGKDTLKTLELLSIPYMIIDSDTDENLLENKWNNLKKYLGNGNSVAFVVKKDGIEYDKKVKYSNNNTLSCEKILEKIVAASGDDIIVSTTGKTSRELFEIREHNGETHKYDFLTVGSMGHSSSIALGIAKSSKKKRVWCVDGDGAAIMHMGALAIIGASKQSNLIHIVINNGAHESVGGMPTVGKCIDFTAIAKACGYEFVAKITKEAELDIILSEAVKANKLTFVEIASSIGSRDNLGRPTRTPIENITDVMKYLRELSQ